MNAYELADDVKNISNTIEALEWVQKATPLLRQQADRIAELEKVSKPVAWMDYLEHSDVYDLNVSGRGIPLYTAPQIKELSDGCGNCHACLVGVIENHMPVTSQRMIVCSDCGNKRCPKASNHRHKCTGSNEVGQYGSIYTAPRELSDEEIKAIANNLTCTPDKNWNVLFAKAILKKASEK